MIFSNWLRWSFYIEMIFFVKGIFLIPASIAFFLKKREVSFPKNKTWKMAFSVLPAKLIMILIFIGQRKEGKLKILLWGNKILL